MIHSVLGRFLGFGHLDGFHIAYLDSARWCQRYGHDIAHAGSFKSHKNAFLNDPKSQKGGFWPFFGLRSFGLTWYCL